MSTYASQVPGAAGYAGAAALAQKAYDNAMARYAQQRGATLLKYGYRRGADGSYSVDPNNEYGAFQQMLKGEAGQHESLTRAQAASGWGASSGVLGQQREDLSYAQGKEQADLGTSLQDSLAQIAQGEQDAGYNRDAALYTAEEQAAQDAINRQQFNPGDYTGIQDQVGYPAGTKAPAPAKKTAKPVPHPQMIRRLAQRQAQRRARAAGRRP